MFAAVIYLCRVPRSFRRFIYHPLHHLGVAGSRGGKIGFVLLRRDVILNISVIDFRRGLWYSIKNVSIHNITGTAVKMTRGACEYI